MSEINRALGSSGNGIKVTLVSEREEELNDLITAIKEKIQAFVFTPAPETATDETRAIEEAEKTTHQALLDEQASLEKELAYLKGEPDKTLILMPMTYKMIGEFEEIIEGRARDSCRRTVRGNLKEARRLRDKLRIEEDTLNDDEQRETSFEIMRLERSADTAEKELDAAIATGEYAYAGGYAQPRTLKGVVTLLHIMLKEKQPQITEQQCAELMTEYAKQLQAAMRQANDDGVMGKKKRAPIKK